MSSTGNFRLGIDIGGTFTDFCLMNEATGALMSVKVPSTPSHPTKSVLEGIKVYGERYRVPAQAIRYFAHGTTIAVNTVIERKGARTGLIVTKGFKDILNLGRACRAQCSERGARRGKRLRATRRENSQSGDNQQ